jgi:hypothetical protein
MMGRTCSYNRYKGNRCRNLVKAPLGKRSLGRPRRGWEDDIKIAIRKKVCDDGSGRNWLRIVSSGGLWY